MQTKFIPSLILTILSFLGGFYVHSTLVPKKKVDAPCTCTVNEDLNLNALRSINLSLAIDAIHSSGSEEDLDLLIEEILYGSVIYLKDSQIECTQPRSMDEIHKKFKESLENLKHKREKSMSDVNVEELLGKFETLRQNYGDDKQMILRAKQ